MIVPTTFPRAYSRTHCLLVCLSPLVKKDRKHRLFIITLKHREKTASVHNTLQRPTLVQIDFYYYINVYETFYFPHCRKDSDL